MVKMMKSCTADPQPMLGGPVGQRLSRFSAAYRSIGHKDASCCAVRWTSPLGLQFHMDWVGWVIDLS